VEVEECLVTIANIEAMINSGILGPFGIHP